jgi:hypothetical protein
MSIADDIVDLQEHSGKWEVSVDYEEMHLQANALSYGAPETCANGDVHYGFADGSVLAFFNGGGYEITGNGENTECH